MASLFRRSRTVKDPKTGETRKKLDEKWIAKWTDAHGNKRRDVLFRNRKASEQRLAELIRENELSQVGLGDVFQEQRLQPVSAAVDEFKKYLESRNDSEDHISQTVYRCKTAFAGCRYLQLMDLDDSQRLPNWLATQRGKVDDPMSVATSNHYLGAVKAFGKWGVKARLFPASPFEHLEKLNATADIVIKRRSLSADEVSALINAANASLRLFRSLTGQTRAVLYLIAGTTGFRANEIATLTENSFDFEATPATVKIKAENAKSKKEATLPLHPYTALKVSEWIKNNRDVDAERNSCLWPGGWSNSGAEMFRRDLAEARATWLESIEDIAERQKAEKSRFLLPENEHGETADFHALRHTFCTMLASSGVHPNEAKELARHSTIRLTMDRYSHTTTQKLDGAIRCLPTFQVSEVPSPVASLGNPDSVLAPPAAPTISSCCDLLTTVDDTQVLAESAENEETPLKHMFSEGFLRGSGRSRTDDDGFAIRCLSHLATEPANHFIDKTDSKVESTAGKNGRCRARRKSDSQTAEITLLSAIIADASPPIEAVSHSDSSSPCREI